MLADKIFIITIFIFNVHSKQSPRIVPNSVILLKIPDILKRFRVNNPRKEEKNVGKQKKNPVKF